MAGKPPLTELTCYIQFAIANRAKLYVAHCVTPHHALARVQAMSAYIHIKRIYSGQKNSLPRSTARGGEVLI